jgi:TolA-binding protein
MSCPENLLVAHRRGALTLEEGLKLDAHLARCATCRLTLQLGRDFDDALDTMPGDELVAARFARDVGRRYEKAKRPRASPRALFWIAAALTLIAGGVAAASFTGLGFIARDPASAPARRAPSKQLAPEPPARDEEAPREEREEAAPPETVDATPRPSASAAELFARANALRRAREPRRAREVYRQLQREHPRSEEAEISLVSLGRVRSELGEHGAALSQFDRYLRRRPRGSLAEEALVGRASALGHLGRRAEERSTWERLLREFPGSIYAARARGRLERLP